ncbi:MAG: TonB-dependent receptor domain-containing protein, partial [Sphingobacteriales bacterium]
YAQGSLSYKDYVFLTVGGRNSWTSNLEKDNRKKFYPSGSISFIPTSAIAALSKSKIVNYLKIRAGYATSANFGSPYRTRATLGLAPNSFVDRSGNAINAVSIGNRLPNPNLKPELLNEVEVGLEGKFIDNHLNVDLTLYKRVSKDQILRRDLDPATGYTAQDINAGNVRNKGIELGIGYTVIRNKDWRWQIDANYTLNRSLVYGLPDYIKQIVIDGFSNQGLFAINGQPLGILQGSYTKKDLKTGQRLTGDDGYYISSNENGITGDPTPLYKVTGISTLGYKGFSFRMQWDFTKGGQMLAYTPGTLVGRGLTKDTDFDRSLPWILPGINENTGKPNDVQISSSEAYFDNLSGFFGMDDLIVYDATVIRLREASLSYSLPENILGKTPFGSVQFTLSGQNLWYKAPNFPKYVNFDPETSSIGVSNVRGLEYLSGPTSRRIGVSVRVTF